MKLSKRILASSDAKLIEDERIARWKEQFINKRLAPIKAPISGIIVYIVNGEAVRDTFESDYSQGGNGFRYTFIPFNEVWIEDRFSEQEMRYIVTHECEELVRMRDGMSYSKAHDEAKAIEDKMRHKDLMDKERHDLGVSKDPTLKHPSREKFDLSDHQG